MSHPFYLFLTYIPAKFYSFFTGNLLFEQTGKFVSATSDSLCIILLYYITLFLFKEKIIAVISIVLFSFCPVTWFLSEQLLTEMPGLIFVLTGIVLMFLWYENNKISYLILSFFIFGLSFLIRLSHYFILPAYILPVIYKSFKGKNFLPLILSPLCIVPYLIFVLYAWQVQGASLQLLFHVKEEYKFFFFKLFTLDSWATFLKITTSSVTVLITVFFLISFITFLLKKDKNLFPVKIFIVTWIIPFIIVWRTYEWVFQHARIILPLIVPVILVTSWGIFEFSKYFFKLFIKRNYTLSFLILFLISTVIVSDHFLMNNIEHFLLIKGIVNFIKEKGTNYFLFLTLKIIFISFFINFAIIKLLKNKETKILSHFFAVLFTGIFAIHMILYILPLLFLEKNKLVYEKAEALYMRDNTPSDSVLIGGHEYPYYQAYCPKRKLINMWYLDNSMDWIKNILNSGKKIFVCENDYVNEWLEKNKNSITYTVHGIIPKGILRNQHDCDYHYLNYATFKKAEDIKVYELKILKQ